MGITITIPDSAQISESELKQEVALVLYQQERLTLAQASDLANMTRLSFQRLLGSRHISIYDVSDFEQDIKNLKALGRL